MMNVRSISLGILAVCTSSIASCASYDYKLNGSITVQGDKPDFAVGRGQRGTIGDTCFTSGGYSDLAEDMQVSIKNGKDETLALGRLSSGKFTKAEGWTMACTFTFTVANIPKSDFYKVEAGRRGVMSYSFQELEQANWRVDYSLGN